MLAESAMEMLRGGFINQLCSISISIDGCTRNGAGGAPLGLDFQRAGAAVSKNMNNPTALDKNLLDASVRYVFYVGAANQELPGILQNVANHGAGVDGTACGAIGDKSFAIPADCKLDINALFAANHSPELYTTKSNGLLIPSLAANWQAELNATGNNDTVAAAWIEITVNAEDDNKKAVDVWVQASAQVGLAKSYVQRYVGTYYPNDTLGSVSGLVEASNIDRGVVPP